MIARQLQKCLAIAAAIVPVAVATLRAQDTAAAKKKAPAPFWQATTPLELTLTINVKRIKADRTDSSPWRWARVEYKDGAESGKLPARIRTRGISRLKICDFFPPTWIDFKGEDVKGGAFKHMNRFKLVAPCKAQTMYERFVLEELALYKVNAILTPISHATRLVKLTVVDSANNKPAFTRWAFALEDVDELAARLGGKKFAITGASGDDLAPMQTVITGVLQYMIGNTDFSIMALHNAELLMIEGKVFPIVYDFDQSGAVDPPYAIPDPIVGVRSVRERVYRGLCVSPDTLKAAFAEFVRKRPQIEAVYAGELGTLIGGNVKSTLDYFGEFYRTISDPKKAKKEIADQCKSAR